MDKQTGGKSITIKINGDQRTFLEEPITKKAGSCADENDLSQNSASTLSDSSVEKPIVNEEMAAAQEIAEESFDWIIPEESVKDISEYTVKNSLKFKKGKVKYKDVSPGSKTKNYFAIKSIIISIFFAIFIGVSLGAIMLKLVVTNNTRHPTVTTTHPTNSNTLPQIDTPKNEKTSVTLSSWTPFVVQGGIFSTKAGAQAIANARTSIGLPCEIIELNGKYSLFLGVSNTIESAKDLANSYKKNGISEVYAKPLSIPEKNIVDVNQNEKSFLNLAPNLYQMISNIISNGMLNNKEISKDSLTSIESNLENINIKQITNKKVKLLANDLITAVSQLKNFQKSLNQKDLINAQQNLLKYLSAYYSI